MKKLVICLGCLCLCLSACSEKHKIPKQFQPTVNPHPKYFMTVEGRIDPALMDRVRLTWVATYSTNNPKCQYLSNKFAGVHSPQTINHKFFIKPNSEGYYRIKINLDHFQPGLCDWRLGYINYREKEKTKLDIGGQGIFFSNAKDTPKTRSSAYDEWICKNDSCQETKLTLFQNPSNDNLPIEKNYLYKLNIKGNPK